MSRNTIKSYTVRVNEVAASSPLEIWYKRKVGEQFRTRLVAIENAAGEMVPVFKCTTSPFFHIYPIHCSIVKEETLSL